MKRKLVTLLVLIAALCWATGAMAEDFVPPLYSTEITPDFDVSAVEVTYTQLSDDEWLLTFNPALFEGEGGSSIGCSMSDDYCSIEESDLTKTDEGYQYVLNTKGQKLEYVSVFREWYEPYYSYVEMVSQPDYQNTDVTYCDNKVHYQYQDWYAEKKLSSICVYSDSDEYYSKEYIYDSNGMLESCEICVKTGEDNEQYATYDAYGRPQSSYYNAYVSGTYYDYYWDSSNGWHCYNDNDEIVSVPQPEGELSPKFCVNAQYRCER